MIRLAISPAAFDAIAATLPLGSVGYNERGERLIWVETAVADKPAAMRSPGEATATSSYSSSRPTRGRLSLRQGRPGGSRETERFARGAFGTREWRAPGRGEPRLQAVRPNIRRHHDRERSAASSSASAMSLPASAV